MPEKMKLFRLQLHQRNYGGNLILNPRDLPDAKPKSIVEIYHPEDEGPRLLLQVENPKEDYKQKDTISIEQSIAQVFNLRAYADVVVSLVDPTLVSLDSVEVTFKDQYFARSDMWKLKECLVDRCIYLTQKIEFCGGSVRCQVYEMWSQGERVGSGVVTKDTKVVFRSLTGMVYLFIQMSSEMWDFDVHGDLYFEKAVNGFLCDLFTKWKKQGSNHEVTIVLFSRTFYKASSIEEFPDYMRPCLEQDHRGRFYEDFYRVAIQNERSEDWTMIVSQLKQAFYEYPKKVLSCHQRPSIHVPKAINSSASQGNFLEVLNISLTVFEKHYVDRSFDRTGQVSVVITPGVGVFEVDRELTNITKQRIIDNGVGSDLVCLGEQPLHAVPLFKYHNKLPVHQSQVVDDFSMPHWINLSFYTSNKQMGMNVFVSRVKIPPNLLLSGNGKMSVPSSLGSTSSLLPPTPQHCPRSSHETILESDFQNSVFDYDAYDAQVFKLPASQSFRDAEAATQMHHGYGGHHMKKKTQPAIGRCPYRKMSDADLYAPSHELPSRSGAHGKHSSAINIPPTPSLLSSSYGALDLESRALQLSRRLHESERVSADPLFPGTPPPFIGGSAGSPPTDYMTPEKVSLEWVWSLSRPSFSAKRPRRSLINPFDPSHVKIKLTSNRRRWTHIFPKGPEGMLIQQHHYQAVPSASEESPSDGRRRGTPKTSLTGTESQRSQTLLWGATGEQEWTPALTTGVDWKSLTIPACLPITTDYFPDARSLQFDYVLSDYSLLPEAISADIERLKYDHWTPLTTAQAFWEMIAQRLQQGFQMIVFEERSQPGEGNPLPQGTLGRMKPKLEKPSLSSSASSPSLASSSVYLSIGRIFHKLTLLEPTITVTRYSPRHPYPSLRMKYKYRFLAPHSDTFEVSTADFVTEKLENYKWNYLDNYVATRGDREFRLTKDLKYWRFPMVLLPQCHVCTTKQIVEEKMQHFDVYQVLCEEDVAVLTDGFLKFLESAVNRIRRPAPARKHRQGSSGMRPRLRSLGSRLPDRRDTPPTPSPGLEHQGLADPADSNDGEADYCEGQLLNASSQSSLIAERMRDPKTGVGTLPVQFGLPSFTFVSGEAVLWVLGNVDGIQSAPQAVSLLQNLLSDGYIYHASGDKKFPFLNGFYLYYFVTESGKLPEAEVSLPRQDLAAFQQDFVEVETLPYPPMAPDHAFLAPETLAESGSWSPGTSFKEVDLEVDVNGKSDRIEWAHARYQRHYNPAVAYELMVYWVTATGPLIAELVLGWARKAGQSGFNMVPVPSDPFALPFSWKSDPLRGPIYVPLNTECLMGDQSYLFEGFPEETWNQRMFLLQEGIARRFGFIPCHLDLEGMPGAKAPNPMPQYIHVTGTAFIMIPIRLQSPAQIGIAISGKSTVGFLWAWNFMMTKKWRSHATGDDHFPTKLLADFRRFCFNDSNRLVGFWETCLEAASQSSSFCGVQEELLR